MKNFKLGFGPMSYEIVDALCTSAVPIMIIASRNQVDADGGYVMTTKELKDRVKQHNNPNILLCRDHCGPYFLDSEKDLHGLKAIGATKKTIAADIEHGFDLIHIDTSRCLGTYQVAEELFKFCLDLNPAIKFEFGTEENIGVAAGAEKYKADAAFAREFPNMEFVVAQTGSLTYEDKQAGTFDTQIVKDLVGFAEHVGVKLKEHNADYLSADKIQLRKSTGVHALNIAPQLGVIQTNLLHRLSKEYSLASEWNEFSNQVIASEKWKKWTASNDTNMQVTVAGHYLFKDPSYHRLVQALDNHVKWRPMLTAEIHDLVNLYHTNL